MKLSNVFLANAVVTLVFGLAFLFVPAQTAGLYGVDYDAAATVTARLYGATLLTLGVLTWLLRDAGPSAERQAVVTALFVGAAAGFVVSLLGQLAGLANALGWLTVVIYLAFALAYGYYRFVAETGGARPKLSG